MPTFCASAVACVVMLCFGIVGLMFKNDFLPHGRPGVLTKDIRYIQDASRPGSAIPAPAYRLPDLSNSFQNFTQSDECVVSTLDLHQPFEPLCETRESLLTALSSGGRAGLDAPYQPRGCDMRWYTADEICGILARFAQINVVGDSMMRNLAVAMHVFVRRDLVEGPHAGWADDPPDFDCRCHGAFDHGRCLFNSAYSSALVREHDPTSMKCPQAETASIEFHTALEYPLDDSAVEALQAALPDTAPLKPHAFVYGHGLWNDLNETSTRLWIVQVEDALLRRMPWLETPSVVFPRLFVTPSAAGPQKPDRFLLTQGNKALMSFEQAVGAWVGTRGIEHLGTWNLTVQGASPDGTHAGMQGNLIKAMMIFNWLAMVDVNNH